MRRAADPEKIAAFVLGVIDDENAPLRERLEAAKIAFDRVEGKAVSRSLVMTMTSATLLPPGFDGLSIDARRRALDDLRARALAGDLPQIDGSDDE